MSMLSRGSINLNSNNVDIQGRLLEAKENVNIQSRVLTLTESQLYAEKAANFNVDLFKCKDSVIKAPEIHLPELYNVEIDNCKFLGQVYYGDNGVTHDEF